jgi:hypothetical protein
MKSSPNLRPLKESDLKKQTKRKKHASQYISFNLDLTLAELVLKRPSASSSETHNKKVSSQSS